MNQVFFFTKEYYTLLGVICIYLFIVNTIDAVEAVFFSFLTYTYLQVEFFFSMRKQLDGGYCV